jgi:hypothetical protein
LVLAEPIESAAGWEMFPLLPETRQSGALLRETAVFFATWSAARMRKKMHNPDQRKLRARNKVRSNENAAQD